MAKWPILLFTDHRAIVARTKLGLSRDQVLIMTKLVSEQGVAELMEIMGRTNRTKFRDQVLNPLIEAGLVEMTIQEQDKEGT